jgi:hypothetical protein
MRRWRFHFYTHLLCWNGTADGPALTREDGPRKLIKCRPQLPRVVSTLKDASVPDMVV